MANHSKARIKARSARKPENKGGGYTVCQSNKMAKRQEQGQIFGIVNFLNFIAFLTLRGFTYRTKK